MNMRPEANLEQVNENPPGDCEQHTHFPAATQTETVASHVNHTLSLVTVHL